MKGWSLLYEPNEPTPFLAQYNKAPELEELQNLVDGYIEKVPLFNTIKYDGGVHHCVAICNEEGKLKNFAPNDAATQAWYEAASRARYMPPADILVGNVIIFFGDEEFMEAL